MFAFLNIYIALLTDEFSQRVLIINLLLAVAGILLTHVYRGIILRYHWSTLPTEKLIIRVIAGLLLLSFFYSLFYYLLYFGIYGGSFSLVSIQTYLGSYLQICLLFGLWNAFYFIWAYIEHNRHLHIESLKMETEMKDLEIRTIRSNLQPHFIFNALNSIRALIDEDPELARKAITRISNILRKTIVKQQLTDTLENELALVEDYLALEKIRFEERLRFSKTIAPDTLSIQIPTMMLQTLIENAIKHGISMLDQGGEIRILSEIRNHKLHLEVINTGTLNQGGSPENSLGFGVSSTLQRLQYLYGTKASHAMYEKNNEVHVLIIIEL